MPDRSFSWTANLDYNFRMSIDEQDGDLSDVELTDAEIKEAAREWRSRHGVACTRGPEDVTWSDLADLLEAGDEVALTMVKSHKRRDNRPRPDTKPSNERARAVIRKKMEELGLE